MLSSESTPESEAAYREWAPTTALPFRTDAPSFYAGWNAAIEHVKREVADAG